MTLRKLLIANRGEIAIRIARAAADLGIRTVSVAPADDAASLHVRRTDETVALPGRGARAYLDAEALLRAACDAGCDAVHPGYGFFSENAAFANTLQRAGVTFVGPSVETLEAFGHKGRARELAETLGIPVLRGTHVATGLDAMRAFQASTGAVMIKAVAGGGGRGMRRVERAEDLDAAFATCAGEAQAAFGDAALYVEEAMSHARHVEVQIVGDGTGCVRHVWERECSLQRRHQKLVEIAPAPALPAKVREALLDAAIRMGERMRYRGLGTIEFLVDARGRYIFLEANPRLQVEHTVTEAVTGLDLVQLQLRIAGGATIEKLVVPEPRGYAMQLRVNLETVTARGDVQPASGAIAVYEPPAGPGIRVDGCGFSGFQPNPQFDSLVAKLIVHTPDGDFRALVRRARRALAEFRLEGTPSNLAFLSKLLARDEVVDYAVHTTTVEEHLHELADAEKAAAPAAVPEDAHAVLARWPGSVMEWRVEVGARVRRGEPLLVLEAMKMEHVVEAPTDAILTERTVATGDVVRNGQLLARLEPTEADGGEAEVQAQADPDRIRPDLAEVLRRLETLDDASRPDAVERRRRRKQRTARENVADLCDPGSFQEYGALALAAQRQRHTEEELIRISPADGFVCGTATIGGGRAVVMAYDFTVYAGTQGLVNHRKLDRMVAIAERERLPMVLFGEGGGGRPNDFADFNGVAGLDTPSFRNLAALSGLVPTVAIVSGRCFAGNAALVGCCDVIIATENSNIGMGGPAMIEGGGLGKFAPEAIGPIGVLSANGVVDVRVADEAAGVSAAKQYLSYFRGRSAQWAAADERLLRAAIPEHRRRAYDVHRVIELVADTGSVLELRREFGVGAITALVRVEGRPIGLVANNPHHLGGAIDAPACDKMARFLQLCDAFDLPVLSLCDTPGFMVGPASEEAAMVRHAARLFTTAASLSVPYFTIVLRKGYGLGAQAMTAGHFNAPVFTVAWPTGEFGAMGLEGAVRLGFAKDLEAAGDEEARAQRFREMVDQLYARGKALSTASYLEIDGVIDPAESRRWIVRGLDSVAPPAERRGKKRPFVDPW